MGAGGLDVIEFKIHDGRLPGQAKTGLIDVPEMNGGPELPSGLVLHGGKEEGEGGIPAVGLFVELIGYGCYAVGQFQAVGIVIRMGGDRAVAGAEGAAHAEHRSCGTAVVRLEHNGVYRNGSDVRGGEAHFEGGHDVPELQVARLRVAGFEPRHVYIHGVNVHIIVIGVVGAAYLVFDMVEIGDELVEIGDVRVNAVYPYVAFGGKQPQGGHRYVGSAGAVGVGGECVHAGSGIGTPVAPSQEIVVAQIVVIPRGVFRAVGDDAEVKC